MDKISLLEAVSLITEASRLSKKYKGYRFGQALWNLLPVELWQQYTGTDIDFFYWVDEKSVEETFFKHYVRNEW